MSDLKPYALIAGYQYLEFDGVPSESRVWMCLTAFEETPETFVVRCRCVHGTEEGKVDVSTWTAFQINRTAFFDFHIKERRFIMTFAKVFKKF